MNTLIDNYSNGNLTTAKKQAKRYSLYQIFMALRVYGYGTDAAEAIANYLKGYGSFQAACDAEHAERQVRA